MSEAVAAAHMVAASDQEMQQQSSSEQHQDQQQDQKRNLADARYSYDNDELEKLKTQKPWMENAKYFQKVAISPSAIMKMSMHCSSGVQKGISKGGNPIEVMGLLLGRPDPTTPQTLVVTDAFPLPIEGFETRVIADDQEVVNHMISLGECLERSRKEKFMGWYHSHPFDLGDHSHCFLSQTDLSTQLQWQRAEDPHGNPFVAIVLDPLRSIHTNIPQLKAFRAYPPEYNSNIMHECPDGSIEPVEQIRMEHWGSCWNRYYELKVEYYMSSTSRSVLEQLTSNYLWMRTLENRTTPTTKQETQSLESINSQLSTFMGGSTGNAASTGVYGSASERGAGGGPNSAPVRPQQAQRSGSGSGGGGGGAIGVAAGRTDPQVPRVARRTEELNNTVEKLVNMATDSLGEASLLQAKQKVFQHE